MSDFKRQISHFVSATRTKTIELVDAIAEGKRDVVASIRSEISQSTIITNISNGIRTSKQGLDNFLSSVREILNDEALRFLVGGVMAGVGGGIFSEAAGLAAAVGISVLSVEVIAIILIVVGLYLCGTAIWKKVKSKQSEWMSAFSNV